MAPVVNRESHSLQLLRWFQSGMYDETGCMYDPCSRNHDMCVAEGIATAVVNPRSCVAMIEFSVGTGPTPKSTSLLIAFRALRAREFRIATCFFRMRCVLRPVGPIFVLDLHVWCQSDLINVYEIYIYACKVAEHMTVAIVLQGIML